MAIGSNDLFFIECKSNTTLQNYKIIFKNKNMCETRKIDSIQIPPVAFDRGMHVVQVFVKRSDGETINFYRKFENPNIANSVRELFIEIENNRKGLEK